ncbi:MAG: 6-bladed beta-propeller [Muribaculaceae bacterium]|nr:6-bladed beta-propeller [Muribaculaceae bacterium]
MKSLRFAYLLAAALMCACGGHKTAEGDIPAINLEKEINHDPFDNLDRSNWNLEVINLEATDSTMLDDFIGIGAIDDNDVWVYNFEKLYDFAHNGKCKRVIAKRGNGPGEYVNLLGVAQLPDRQLALIGAPQAVLCYSPAGKWESTKKVPLFRINVVKNDIVGMAYTFEETGKEDNSILWMDENLNVTDSLSIQSHLDPDGQLSDPSLHNNFGKPTLLMNDTIFNLAEKGKITPLITLQLGKYKMPNEVRKDWDRSDEMKLYILPIGLLIWEDYAFVEYGYDNKTYFDIWNINDMSLCFRNIMEDPEPPAGFPMRLPDGKEIGIWPTKVIDGKLLGVVMPSLQSDPSYQDANPSIFIITR